MAVKIEAPRLLDPDQRGVFDRMSRLIRSPDADARYDGFSGSERGKIISVDVARLFAPEFGSWDGRLRHTPSTANPAGAYAHDRLRRELAIRRHPTKRLLITAGGAGSGKTSLLSRTTAVTDLVFDNQFRSQIRSREILRLAIRHEWDIEVVYVHRPFHDVVLAVIERSQRTGRWNSLADLAAMHIEAQQTIVRLWLEFKNQLLVHAVYNSSSGQGELPQGSPVSIRELDAGGRYHLRDGDEVLQNIPSILEEASRQHLVCKEVAQIIGAGLTRREGA